MIKFSEHVQSWYMPETVIGNFTEPTGSGKASSYTVHIPLLMPMIGFGKKKQQAKNLNKSCYCNDSKCKPAIASTISIQNYVTVPCHANNNLKYSTIRQGARFLIEAIDGDYDTLRITNHLDDSYTP